MLIDDDDTDDFADNESRRGRRIYGPCEADIAKRVRELREFRGLRQGDLGDLVGITYQQIYKYEASLNRISCGVLKRIADALDVSPGYFFGETDEVISAARQGGRKKMQFMNNLNELSPAEQTAIMKMVNDLAKAKK